MKHGLRKELTWAACAVVLLCSLPFAAAKGKPLVTTADRDYVAALAAANRFLQSWQSQDRETGLVMLTDAAKRRASEDRLQTFFSSTTAVQQAFEIGRGKKLAAGRYSFPVTLFQAGSDPACKRVHPRYSQIIVTRAGANDWAIDKVP